MYQAKCPNVLPVSVVLQVRPELPMPGPLHDDPDGRLELVAGGGGADAEELDDVLVVKHLHRVWNWR